MGVEDENAKWYTAKQVFSHPSITQLFCGVGHNLIQTDNGLFGCGINEFSQLGIDGNI